MNSADAATELKRLDDELKTARQSEAAARLKASDLHRQGTGLATWMIGRWDDVEHLIPDEFRPPNSESKSYVGTDRAAASTPPTADKPKQKQVRHADMVEWCRQILTDRGGGPIHVSEIRDDLERDEKGLGWRVPGQGLEGNVGVHLGRAPEVFESGPLKGTWKLRGGI